MGHFSLSADEQKAPSFVHTHFLKASALQAQKSGGEKCFIDLGVRRHRPRTFLEMDRTLNIALSLWGGLVIPSYHPKNKYFLANVHDNNFFLRVSKLRAWPPIFFFP